MRTKANRKVSIEKLDASNYEVPAGEERYYHARIEVKKFDANTGQRQSIPRVQKFGSKGFKVVQKNLKKQGYTIDILHDPTKWLEENKKVAEQTALERSQAKQAAANEKAAADRAALKAELMAEIKAELAKENASKSKETKAEKDAEAKDADVTKAKEAKATEAKK